MFWVGITVVQCNIFMEHRPVQKLTALKLLSFMEPEKSCHKLISWSNWYILHPHILFCQILFNIIFLNIFWRKLVSLICVTISFIPTCSNIYIYQLSAMTDFVDVTRRNVFTWSNVEEMGPMRPPLSEKPSQLAQIVPISVPGTIRLQLSHFLSLHDLRLGKNSTRT